jgi:hypothetical protein
MVTVKIFDNEPFVNTGWDPKSKTVIIPSGSWAKATLNFLAVSAGDPYDRFYSVAANKMELHRGITPFGGSIASSEDITNFSRIFSGSVNFQVILTTWGSGGWRVTLTLELEPGSPPNLFPIPIMLWQMTETSSPIRVPININSPGGVIVLHATGHYYEEGLNRYVNVKADGSELMRILATRWIPGQGRVAPYIKEVGAFRCSEINSQVESGGKYWKLSLSFLNKGLPPPPPFPLQLIAPFFFGFLFVGLTLWTKPR